MAIEQEKEAKELVQAKEEDIKQQRKEIWHEPLKEHKSCQKKTYTYINQPKATTEECTTTVEPA